MSGPEVRTNFFRDDLRKDEQVIARQRKESIYFPPWVPVGFLRLHSLIYKSKANPQTKARVLLQTMSCWVH